MSPLRGGVVAASPQSPGGLPKESNRTVDRRLGHFTHQTSEEVCASSIPPAVKQSLSLCPISSIDISSVYEGSK